MLYKFFARRAIKKFAERYNYNADYMYHMLDVAPAAFAKFAPLSRVAAHRDVLPAETAAAAKIRGAMAEDCGPCAQLSIDMAREAGVDESQIAAIVQQDVEAMQETTALGFHFAMAVLANTPQVTICRDAVRAKWGDQGVVELTLALQISRVFPMLKAGLGYAESCQRLQSGTQQFDMIRAFS